MEARLDLVSSYELIQAGACALVTSRDALVVAGPDARSWLQGQLSQDLGPLGAGQSAETLVLSPQGKVDVYGRVTILGDDVVLLDTEPGFGEVLSERLRRFRLRVKAELESGTIRCVAVRGPGAREALAAWGLQSGGIVGSAPPESLRDGWVVAVPVNWAGLSGFDVLASPEAPEVALGEVAVGDPAAFEAARIEAGVPVMGRELTDKTIPQEAGELVEHTVSFTKGCFTGQELVARLDARGGNVARRLRGVVMDQSGIPEVGATLSSDGREVGRLTSTAFSPGLMTTVALAYVRRDVVPPAGVVVAPGETPAEIRELPLQIR